MPPSQSQQTNIWTLAWPSISVYLLNTISALIIMKVVGALGTSEVATVTTGTRIQFFVQSTLVGLSTGAAALVAYAIGAKKITEAGQFTCLSIGLGSVFAVVMTLATYFLAPAIASFFQLSGVTGQNTIVYLRLICLFNINFALIIMLSAALRAAGDARSPLNVALITNGLYVFLSIVLTYGWMGFPNIGLNGSAIGAGIAYITGSFILFAKWYKGRLVLPYMTGFFNRARSRRLWPIALPAIAEQGVMQGSLLIFVWFVAGYGEAAFAAYGIGLAILSVTMVVGLGFSIAGAALVGQALGANDVKEANRVAINALKLAAGAMTSLGLVVLIFAEPLAALMIDDPETIRLTKVFLWMLAAVQPLLAVDFALGGALRGAGDTRFPLLSTFCGFVMMRLLLAAIFYAMDLPVEYIFGTLIADYFVKASMIIWRFKSGRWLHALHYKTDR